VGLVDDWRAGQPHIVRRERRPACGRWWAIGELWLLGVIQMASFGLMIVVGTWITCC
jgi:hypothetical protein